MKNGPGEPRAGRRSGHPDTKAAILEAARAHFTKSGYAATVRAIAADAGVDAAMINYFFGSKKQLFGAAFAQPANQGVSIAAGLRGPMAEPPRRLLSAMVETWDDVEKRPALLALMMLDIAHLNNVGGLGSAADDSDEIVPGRGLAEEMLAAPRRSALLGTQLLGVLFARYVLRVGPVAAMPAPTLIEGMLPALDAVLDQPSE